MYKVHCAKLSNFGDSLSRRLRQDGTTHILASDHMCDSICRWCADDPTEVRIAHLQTAPHAATIRSGMGREGVRAKNLCLYGVTVSRYHHVFSKICSHYVVIPSKTYGSL